MDNICGKLYPIATPIGNLGDFSPRAIETLEQVDFIAAEDTRVTMKLLNRFEIKKPLISYYEHNRREKGEYIVSRIEAGESCALVTDAGSPAISDPGTELVDLCIERGIEVVPIPGCCAIITALCASGIECGRFTFEGFLSTANKSRIDHLESVAREKRTMVFYEAPHKLLRTLEDMYKYFGDREIALCRELTKLHEEISRTTLSAAIAKYTETPPKGEFVIVIRGYKGEDEAAAQKPDPLQMVKQLMAEGKSLKDAVKETSKALSYPKNHLYDAALEMMSKEEQ